MLMRPQHGRVQQDPGQVGGLNSLKEALPPPFLGQSAEAFANRISLAKALRQVSPGAASPCNPQHAVEKQAVIFSRYPAVGDFARQVGGDQDPGGIRNFVAAHNKVDLPQIYIIPRYCPHALVPTPPKRTKAGHTSVWPALLLSRIRC